MRVLHVIDSFSNGGAERLLATLSKYSSEVGLELSAAGLTSFSPDRAATMDLLDAAGLQPAFVGVRRLLDPSAVPRLRRLISRAKCDVVHAHLGYSAALVPVAARSMGIPCISTLHHLPSRDRPRRELAKEWIWTRSAERGAALVYVSHAALRSAADLVGPPRPTWRVLHNGVDLADLTPPGPERAPLPRDLGLPHNVPVVSLVAAVRHGKGHEIALRAWPQVRARVPDAVLLIVGEGPYLPELRTMAGDGVVFAGPRTDVPDILRGSTLGLLPSMTEALPTALIEAAGCGLPVVATTVGGIPEIVEHGRTGLLIPPDDVDALVVAVGELLSSSTRRAAFGAAARALAEERFDVHKWMLALRDLYDEALARNRPASGPDGG